MKGNEQTFQQQFRADPATSHGMLVAGSLARERSMPRLCLMALGPLGPLLEAKPVRLAAANCEAEASPFLAARVLAIVDIRPRLDLRLCAQFVTHVDRLPRPAPNCCSNACSQFGWQEALTCC